MTKTTLSVGDQAPSFDLTDVMGNKVHLKDYSGSYLLLAFLRYSGCPWCNLAVHRLAVEQPLLKNSKCEVVVFIQSSTENIEKNILKRHKLPPKFPIIADPSRTIYQKYFVTPSVSKTLRHVITHIPACVTSAYGEGYKQTAIDGNSFIAPATFLLARDTQKIVRIDYNADLYDHQSFTDIYDSISDHQIYGFGK
ncbi:MAG: redoxin domain-containing protein [Candidatus Saccharimonadales bacterium]